MYKQDEAALFYYKPIGEVTLKYAWEKIYRGAHNLKCQFLGVGFHSIKDLAAYVYGIDNDLIVLQIQDNEEVKQTMEVLLWKPNEFVNTNPPDELPTLAKLPWITPLADRKFLDLSKEIDEYITD